MLLLYASSVDSVGAQQANGLVYNISRPLLCIIDHFHNMTRRRRTATESETPPVLVANGGHCRWAGVQAPALVVTPTPDSTTESLLVPMHALPCAPAVPAPLVEHGEEDYMNDIENIPDSDSEDENLRPRTRIHRNESANMTDQAPHDPLLDTINQTSRSQSSTTDDINYFFQRDAQTVCIHCRSVLLPICHLCIR
jgi:hypothetical protein